MPVSADPDRLDAVARGAAARADRIAVRAAAMAAALGRVEPGAVGSLAHAGRSHVVALAAVAATDRSLSWRAATVARAMRRADTGGGAWWIRAARAEQLEVTLRSTGRAALVGPDDLAAPDRIATVARRLGPGGLATLAVLRPDLVGPVQGWPLEARYAANLALLTQARLQASGERRRSLDRLARPDPATGRPRQFLLFDPAGDGRVVEVIGDLGSAELVGVLVPGMSATLDRFDRRVAAPARRLQRSAAEVGTAEVAVVAWLGYDAPADLPSIEAASASQARAGGRLLAADLDGLARRGAALTVVGHSYGSVVATEALRAGARPDAILAMGSPGMAHEATRLAADRGTTLYAMRAAGDPLPRVERFGADPSQAGSGFVRLAAGPGGHGSYLDAGSTGLAGAAAVVAGRPDLGTPQPSSRADAACTPRRAVPGWITAIACDAAGDLLAARGSIGS